MVRYRFRKSVLGDEETFTLNQDTLSWGKEKPWSSVWNLSEITDVNLRYDPTRFSRERYKIVLQHKSGKSLTLSNMSYQGVGDFESRNHSYNSFVRALHSGLLDAGGETGFHGGVSKLKYLAYWLLTVGVGVLLVAASIAFFAIGLSWLVIIKLLLIAFYFPTLIAFMKRAKPFDYPGDAIPSNLLP